MIGSGRVPKITYSAMHWRQMIDATVLDAEPRRVLMRQVRVDGEATHAEILDGKWRELRDRESFLPARRNTMPQIDNDWVR